MKKTERIISAAVISVILAASGSSLYAKEAPALDFKYVYSGNDLGVTLDGSKASFKLWAPLASGVRILLFKDSQNLSRPAKMLKMTKSKDAADYGIWSCTADTANFSYYQYEIQNPEEKVRVPDIYALSASPDSVASQLVNINTATEAMPENAVFDKEWGTKEGYYNPFGNSGAETKAYTDAVIFEMHIRDWSNVEVADSTGKFLQIADGDKVISYIKDLGATHVQILPMFDYAQLNSDKNYNWGYNPYNYNVPEGRYVTEGYTDGTQAVKEMRTMIAKLHENGIAVIMDVVYNHTNGTGDGSIYDMTVPGYWYRYKKDGSYSNGSGCGNEVATNNPMVRKFLVDSVKHWVLDYHVNGFRFDLMGLHERDTMTAVWNALYEIDPNIMIYGEPWTGGQSQVKFAVSKSTVDLVTDDSTDVNGLACFNDNFRDAIKGDVFSPTAKGFVQGNASKAPLVCSGLTGSLRGKGGFTKKIGRSINYAECHDNHTLFDRLAISEMGKNTTGILLEQLTPEQVEIIRQEDKLAAALIFLAQGTPFINGGQEFMRTKNGNGNSYIASNRTNGIDLSMKDTYSDVYNTYKSLIAFRKANSGSFGQNYDAAAEILDEKVIKYTAGSYVVYFNCDSSARSIADSGKPVTISESDGTFSTGTSQKITSVPARGFVIIQK